MLFTESLPKKFSFFLIMCSFFVSNGQEKVNQLDAIGKKEVHWKGIYEKSQKPRYQGTFRNGVEIDTFKYFEDSKAQSLIAIRVFSNKGL